MSRFRIASLAIAIAIALAGALAGCGGSSSNGPRLSAEIRRTAFGIPHVRADDWAGLGYGYGYAYAQDNFCVTMREIALSSGRSAELMGEVEGDAGIDALMRYLNGSPEEFRERFVDRLSRPVRDLGVGFAAGMNRYLRETGRDGLAEGPAGCRDAPWVFEIDDVDLWVYLRRIALGGSTDLSILRDAILAVEGPAAASSSRLDPAALRADRDALARLARGLAPPAGSNGIALGRDRTRDGRGMLLGNPHQPWNGGGRWYEVHLTIPGVYDAAGAALQGLPWVGIGFNADVAWTHTVSQASRFTLYELELDPADPFRYRYDGEWRAIEAHPYEITVRRADGSLETRTRTIYASHYGPIVNLASFTPLLDGWPMANGKLLSLKDANLETPLRSGDQWLTAGSARDLDEYTRALRAIGNPVFHTLAADRGGEAFYGEVSAIPHVTQAKLESCQTSLVSRVLASATTGAILALDGSTSACEWGEDPDSPPGSNAFGYAARPIVRTTDYVANGNNSYWIANPERRLEGFPLVMGWTQWERRQQSLRARIAHVMLAERAALTDGLSDEPGFDLDTLKALMFANRVLGAELTLDGLLGLCDELGDGADGATPDALRSCDALAGWDRRVNVESRGAQVFTELWKVFAEERGNLFQGVIDDPAFWTVDFDPADPVNTPRGLDLSAPGTRRLALDALAEAARRLDAAGVALDAPWGEVQFYPRNGERVPLHGGAGGMGTFGVISAPLEPGGYFDVAAGNSYVQAVTWDDGPCPIADTIVPHSQSTDPASPHFGDQTRLYARKEWVRFPYCEADIAARQIGDTLLLTE